MSDWTLLLLIVLALIFGWSTRGVYDARVINRFREELERSIRDL